MLILSLLTSISVFAQTTQKSKWLKAERENLYQECVDLSQCKKTLTEEQRESLCLCYLNEIEKNYTKEQFRNLIDVELKRAQQSVLTLCAENLGIDYSTQKIDLSLKPVDTAIEKPKTDVVLSKKYFVGTWLSDVGTFNFLEYGEYRLSSIDNKICKGYWYYDGKQLKIDAKMWGCRDVEFDIINYKADEINILDNKDKKLYTLRRERN